MNARNMVIPIPRYMPTMPSRRNVSFTQCQVDLYVLSPAIKGLLISFNDDIYCVWYLVLIVSSSQLEMLSGLYRAGKHWPR